MRLYDSVSVFFKCSNRSALAAWYQDHLGLSINELGGVEFDLEQLPPGSYCVWGPFESTSSYFSPSPKEFMINLIVDDLEAALAQVEAAGAERVGGIEEYSYGRFGWFLDPDRNKIELWEPRPRVRGA